MSRTFRNVDPFYTPKEIKSDSEYYKRKCRVTKKNQRVKVEKYDNSSNMWNWKTCGTATQGQLSGWNDFPKCFKKIAKRIARAQQKSMLRNEVHDYYVQRQIDNEEYEQLMYEEDCSLLQNTYDECMSELEEDIYEPYDPFDDYYDDFINQLYDIIEYDKTLEKLMTLN